MNNDTHPFHTRKKHLIAIAVIVALGVALGSAILGGKATQHAEDDGHGHGSQEPSKAHSDSEHHDEKAHEDQQPGHDKDHAHGEHPEEPSQGSHGDKLRTQGSFGLAIELSDAQIQAASIRLESAGAARIQSLLQLQGEIRLNEDQTSHVVPRMAGVVERVQVSLGQAVKKGQVLAIIASPAASEQRSELQTAQQRLALAHTTRERERRLWEQKISAEQDYLQAEQAWHEAKAAVTNAQQKLSALGLTASASGGLNRLELRAPLDGVVIEKHLSLGEAVKEDTMRITRA